MFNLQTILTKPVSQTSQVNEPAGQYTQGTMVMPCNVVGWLHGVMASWLHGFMASCPYGFMVLTVSWIDGVMINGLTVKQGNR